MVKKGSRILVTGGAGFIGSHLVRALLKESFEVITPYIKIDSRSIFVQEGLVRKVRLFKTNLVDFEKINAVIKKSEPDYIIHLAAQPLVTTAYDLPLQTLETNIMGTVNILESARKHRVKGVIIASSDKAYGVSSKGYKETDPLLGKHPYDVSKSSADLIAQSYFKTYGVPIVITRFGNAYGEGDLHFERLIPGLMQAIILRKTFKVRSNGRLVRDYIHVKDVVTGYYFLLEKMNKVLGQTFNFSSTDNLSVIELIKLTEMALGIKIKYQILNEAKNEILYQHLDDAKIKELGWKQKFNLSNSIKDTFVWYQKLLRSNSV